MEAPFSTPSAAFNGGLSDWRHDDPERSLIVAFFDRLPALGSQIVAAVRRADRAADVIASRRDYSQYR